MTDARLRLDDQLCFALYAVTNAITRAYRPLLRELGITYPQYLTLMALWQHSTGTRQRTRAAFRPARPRHDAPAAAAGTSRVDRAPAQPNR